MSSSRAEWIRLDGWHQNALNAERAANERLNVLEAELRELQVAMSELDRLLGIFRDEYREEVANNMRRSLQDHINDFVQSRIPQARAIANTRKREADATYHALEEWGYSHDNYEHVSRRPQR
jgi:hypothetical protein